MSAHSQISATVSAATKKRVDRFTESHGLKKNFVVEQALLYFITRNWRGRALRTFEAVVQLIGHTKTSAGLRVKAGMDMAQYPTGRTISKTQMSTLTLHKHDFCGEWNHQLHPRPG